MAIDNTVTITGNATRDPELRFTPAGNAVVNFGVAVNRRWQNRQTNEWEEAVSFFDIVAWSQLAENVAESVGKGNRVTVTGRLEQRSWKTDTGENRSKTEIVADDVGPSLRWATATVTRNDYPNEDRAGSGHSGSGYRGQNRGSRPNTGPDRPAYNPDEEPF